MLYSFSKCYILSENCKEKKKTFYSLLHACAAMLYLYFMSACLPRHIQNICLVKVPSSMTWVKRILCLVTITTRILSM
jgi:hypothetical protein